MITVEDTERFQEGINRLELWSRTWQMQFNTSKCKVMHLGRRGNPDHVYMMGDTPLESTSAEKDIGVMVHDSLKPSLHCAKAAAKANAVLGQISRAVMYRDSNTFVRLYIVYVRPILEYCIQAVGPYSEADKLCLEKVQIRAVNMVSNIPRGNYEQITQPHYTGGKKMERGHDPDLEDHD